MMHFNPRTREGCDLTGVFNFFIKSISIHAPARGATMRCIYFMAWKMYFNPRTREGCDASTWLTLLPLSRFQSTHPRGVRLRVTIWDLTISQDFNPRTREGCDGPKGPLLLLQNGISIHAPARGATGTRDEDVMEALNFNPRTREGCDSWRQ